MRVTVHNARTAKNGKTFNLKHNDRNFNIFSEKAKNIDPDRTPYNYYWNSETGISEKLTFEEAELRTYNKLFGQQLANTNNNYIKNGHSERVKSMEEWKKQRNHAPEETVRQVGNIDKKISNELFKKIEKDYENKIDTWNKLHGSPFVVLNRAYHFDETVPHCHERRVWCFKDPKIGILKIGQEKALRLAGVELPFPNKKEDKNNNRKITFDKLCRQMWQESCEKFGLSIEKEPVPNAKHNLEKEEMIREKNEKLIKQNEELINQNKSLENENKELSIQIGNKKEIKKEAIKQYTRDNLTEIKENATNNYLLGFINHLFNKLMNLLGIKNEDEKDKNFSDEVKEYDQQYENDDIEGKNIDNVEIEVE